MEGIHVGGVKMIYKTIQSGSVTKMPSHMTLRILFVHGQKLEVPNINDRNLTKQVKHLQKYIICQIVN